MTQLDTERRKRYETFLKSELEGAAVYDRLAERERDADRAKLFKGLATMELRHAEHWGTQLGLAPGTLKPRLTPRARLLTWVAQRAGSQAILPLVLRREFGEIRTYNKVPEAKSILADERRHAQTVGSLTADGNTVDVIQSDGRYRVANASNIRAAVLGFNDGLVSIFALIAGVAGGTSDSRIIMLAGVAGLLAGAFSMAAGEYLSVRAQCDVYEREVEIEREEIASSPEDETEELTLIYQAKGLTRDEARAAAERILANPKVALDTMAREELGLDPSQMGSPWAVAFSSFAAFSAGGLAPVTPYLLSSGTLALVLSVTLSSVAAFGLGSVLSLGSNKNALWGGIRMLMIGVASASVTFTVGRIIGVSIS